MAVKKIYDNELKMTKMEAENNTIYACLYNTAFIIYNNDLLL